MYMATGSFSLGQAKLFPLAVRESGILLVPAFLPIVLLFYWVIRVRVVPSFKKGPVLPGSSVPERG
jgi:hypothetical protein